MPFKTLDDCVGSITPLTHTETGSRCSFQAQTEGFSTIPAIEAGHLQRAFFIDVGITTITVTDGLQQLTISTT